MERRMSPKGSRTVWSGGKDGDNLKVLPITIHCGGENLRRLSLSLLRLTHVEH